MSGIYRRAGSADELGRRYREFLDAWPVASTEHRVPTREGETFVLVSGPQDAPPLVLLHGSGSNSARWAGDVAVWSERFRVHAVDMVGEPGSSAPSRPELASGAVALWLDDVLAGLGLSRVSIVAESLGGWVALDYATRRPGRVDRMVLLCPGGLGPMRSSFLLTALLLAPFGTWGLRRSLRRALGTQIPAELEEYLLAVHKNFRPRREPLPIFDDDALARLTMPVLAIVGARDAMIDSHVTQRRLEHAAPGATVRLLPDAGHLLPGQTAMVLDFLLQPSPAGRTDLR